MALTASRELNRFVDQELRSFSVAAVARVFKGAIVGVERSTGHVRNLQSGDQFAGIAYEEVNNSVGAGGAVDPDEGACPAGMGVDVGPSRSVGV